MKIFIVFMLLCGISFGEYSERIAVNNLIQRAESSREDTKISEVKDNINVALSAIKTENTVSIATKSNDYNLKDIKLSDLKLNEEEYTITYKNNKITISSKELKSKNKTYIISGSIDFSENEYGIITAAKEIEK